MVGKVHQFRDNAVKIKRMFTCIAVLLYFIDKTFS